jgi:hypothetical protein
MKKEVTQKVIGFYGKAIEVIKDELFVDSVALSEKQSELAVKENNDCFVRAVMVGLDISYDAAHKFVAENFNRRFREGTSVARSMKNIENKTKNGKKIKFLGFAPIVDENLARTAGIKYKVFANPNYKKPTSFTVKSFMQNNPVGRFILIVEGHAIAIANGVLYGNAPEKRNNLYRTIFYGFECK